MLGPCWKYVAREDHMCGTPVCYVMSHQAKITSYLVNHLRPGLTNLQHSTNRSRWHNLGLLNLGHGLAREAAIVEAKHSYVNARHVATITIR